METKHTPAPWKTSLKQLAINWDDPNTLYETKENYREIIAGRGYSGDGFGITGYIGEADAKLIAAAPDMLQALIDARTTIKAFLPEASGTLTVIEEAIKKAGY